MAMKCDVSETDGSVTATIKLPNRFDVSTYKDFSESYKEKIGSVSKWCIDMDQCEYLDSSALGMMLVLRERAGGDRTKIDIVHCRPGVKKILETANFGKLFTIS